MLNFPYVPGQRVRFSAVMAHPFPGPVPRYGEHGTVFEAPPPGWQSGQDPRLDHVLVGWDHTGIVPSFVGNLTYLWRG